MKLHICKLGPMDIIHFSEMSIFGEPVFVLYKENGYPLILKDLGVIGYTNLCDAQKAMASITDDDEDKYLQQIKEELYNLDEKPQKQTVAVRPDYELRQDKLGLRKDIYGRRKSRPVGGARRSAGRTEAH